MEAYLSDAERTARVRRIEDLAAQITELAGHLNAANYRFLTLLAEFDRRQGWIGGGTTRSCAHWLNWKCGIELGAAREKVRTALALEKLPKISAAMERGELSYSKVRALTRVASVETEDYLLSIALHGTAYHVENTLRRLRRCLEAQELSREAIQQQNRSVHYQWDEDGSLILKARLPAETGALVLKALDAAREEIHGKINSTDGAVDPAKDGLAGKPSWAMQRADALGAMAETLLAHGATALSGGDRNQVIVHVSAETLRDAEPGRCEVEDGPAMAAETARRLACDASLVGMVENEHGDPLSVGRKTRSIPAALRRALNSRDQGCRYPGCTHKRYVDAHHIHHWSHGGETRMSNLVTLCRLHHRTVHEGAVRIEILDDGALRFVQPDGRAVDSLAPGRTQPLGDWKQLTAIHEEQGIHINKKTAATRWCGERMDYGLAIEVLLAQAKRTANVSAETSTETVSA